MMSPVRARQGEPEKEKTRICVSFLFQLNPPLRVGEILLRNVKSSLRSGEIAAAVGGFYLISLRCINTFTENYKSVIEILCYKIYKHSAY